MPQSPRERRQYGNGKKRPKAAHRHYEGNAWRRADQRLPQPKPTKRTPKEEAG